jgi:predicted DNA binding protein
MVAMRHRSDVPRDLVRREGSARPRFETLRASEEPAPEAGLFMAKLRFRMSPRTWTGGFSSSHPTVRIEVLNRTDLTEDISISDHWISGHPPGVWAAEIASYPDVVDVESLAEVADGCLYRVAYRNPPAIYDFRRLRMPIQFPLRMQDGNLTWEVVGRRAKLDELVRLAKSRSTEVSVVSVRRRPLRSHLPLLTEAQHRLLTQAMAAGYFAVPRGITLTELARRLGRSKSSVSEAVAVIEKKLLESALKPSTLLP